MDNQITNYYQQELMLPLIENEERTYMGYSVKLRGVLDRFDAIIDELSIKFEGLENEKLVRKKEVDAAFTFFMSTIVTWFIYAILYLISFKDEEGSFVVIRYLIIFLIPITFVFTIWMLVKFLKARKGYEAYMNRKKYKEYIKKMGIITYYEKVEYCAKCLSALKERRKKYAALLVKIDKGEELSKSDIALLENMTDEIYKIPEIGFTLNNM